MPWRATRSGPLAHRTKLRMEDAPRRWKAETHPGRRFRILLDYTALMAEWLDHTRRHLRELDDMPAWKQTDSTPAPAASTGDDTVTRAATAP